MQISIAMDINVLSRDANLPAKIQWVEISHKRNCAENKSFAVNLRDLN